MTVDRVLAIAGLVVGLIAIPISVVIARRGRRKPTLCYVIDSSVIVEPEDDLMARGLTIQLDGREISQLSRTRIAIWNYRGSDPVHGRDIVADDPLRIQLAPGDVALQKRITSCSRSQNKVTLHGETAGNAVPIEFDFVDADDGAVLEVLHEGPQSPTVAGTIRGADIRKVKRTSLDGRVMQDDKHSLVDNVFNRLLLSMIILFVVTVFISTISSIVTQEEPISLNEAVAEASTNFPGPVGAVLAVFAATFGPFIYRYFFPKIPRKLTSNQGQ